MSNQDIPENQLGQENVDMIVKREKIKKEIADFRKKYDEMFPPRTKKQVKKNEKVL